MWNQKRRIGEKRGLIYESGARRRLWDRTERRGSEGRHAT